MPDYMNDISFDPATCEDYFFNYAVLGAGNIGTAVARALPQNVQSSFGGRIYLWNRSLKRLDDFGDQKDTVKTTDLNAALANAHCVFICVEGPAVVPLLKRCGSIMQGKAVTFVSCAASVTLAQMNEALAPFFDAPATARLLPNIAATVGCSVNLFCSHGLDFDTEQNLMTICSALGPVFKGDEADFAAGMALSSCGIAYAARYIRACMSAGVAMGLSADESRQLAVGCVQGAMALLDKHPEQHPEQLIDKVCTPGGLTIAGLNEMETRGFSAAIVAGLEKAARKI